MLATLRTAWLVEERSAQKSRSRRGLKRQSKYRVLQFVYDAEFFIKKLVKSLFMLGTGRGSGDMQEFLKGLRIEISESRVEQVGSRVGAVLGALVAVSICGSLFTISPTFLCCLAVLFGIAW